MTGSQRILAQLLLVTCLSPACVRAIAAQAPGQVLMGPPAPAAKPAASTTLPGRSALDPYAFSPRWDNTLQGAYVLSICRDLRGCT
jgi:hypothetical protein